MVDNSLFNLMGKMLKYVGGWEHLWERDFASLDQRCAGYWEYFTKLISSLFLLSWLYVNQRFISSFGCKAS